MSIASYTLSEPTVAETRRADGKKPSAPQSRTIVAKGDGPTTPEAR